MKQGGKKHYEKNNDPNVRISKALSYLLRHGAEKEGVPIRPDGYVLVQDALKWKNLKGVKLDKIKEVVETNDKKRYELSELEENGQKEYFIRAVQGHTLENVEDDKLLEKINDPGKYPCVIHGTYYKAWDLIKNSGLKTMGRNHVHFAIGLPGNGEVISGMRQTCQVFIEINMEQAMKDGMVFYESKNKVILSSGFNEVIDPKYFKRVVDKEGKVLLEQFNG